MLFLIGSKVSAEMLRKTTSIGYWSFYISNASYTIPTVEFLSNLTGFLQLDRNMQIKVKSCYI